MKMYVLCQIASIKKIKYLKSFPLFDDNEVKEGIRQLEEKKIIVNKEIDKKIFPLLQMMKYYNQSSHFIKIQNAIFAEIAPQEYLMIENSDDRYIVQPVSEDELTVTFLAQFPNVKEVTNDEKKTRQRYRNSKFKKVIDEHNDMGVFFYSKLNEEHSYKEYSGAYFILDNTFNHYMIDEEILEKYPLDHVQEGMERIFSKEVNKYAVQ